MQDRTATHEFAAKAGVNQQFIINVTVSGPGACGSFSDTLEVNVPASCPIAGPITVAQSQLTDNTASFDFRLSVNIPADSYVWTFGDGASPVGTTEPVVTYEFPRWQGKLLSIKSM